MSEMSQHNIHAKQLENLSSRLSPVNRLKNKIFNTLQLWINRHQQRAHLATLDERTLKDIGLSANQVSLEINKPFWK